MPYEAVVAIVAAAAVVVFSIVVNLRERSRRVRQLREAAARLYDDARALHVSEHEHRLVSAEEFPQVPRSGYEAHAAFLLTEGFRAFGLIENVTVSQVHPQHRTYVSVHVSRDGRAIASGWWVSGTQYLEFGSATRDHRYILTSNAQPNLQCWPPSVDNCVLSADTPLDVVLARHRERVSDLEQREPGTVLQTFADMEAVFAAMRRYRQELSVYRKSIGYITLDEMLALATDKAEEQAARRLWAEIRKQRQSES